MRAGDIQVQEVSYRRNGIAGEGFYAVRFLWCLGRGPESFIATVFDGPGRCAVLSLDRMEEDGVAFGRNSWRGDEVEGKLREAIDRGATNRRGPFSA